MKQKKKGLFRKLTAVLLAAMMLAGSSVSVLAVDGGSLGGDPFGGSTGGELISGEGTVSSPESVNPWEEDGEKDDSDPWGENLINSLPTEDPGKEDDGLTLVTPEGVTEQEQEALDELLQEINSKSVREFDPITGTFADEHMARLQELLPQQSSLFKKAAARAASGNYVRGAFIPTNSYYIQNLPGSNGKVATGRAILRFFVNGAPAFCIQMYQLSPKSNGQHYETVASADYSQLTAEQKALITKYLANFSATSSDNKDNYALATQVLIWEAIYGKSYGIYERMISGTQADPYQIGGGPLQPAMTRITDSAARIAAYNQIRDGNNPGKGLLFWESSNWQDSVTIELENTTHKDPQFKLKKVDANDPNKVLEDAEFEIFAGPLDEHGLPSSWFTTLTTGDDGYAYPQKQMDPGTYYAYEITAPEGYELPKPSPLIEFEIKAGQTAPVELVVENGGSPEDWTDEVLRLLKVDADNPSTTLAGAKFSVYKGTGIGGEKVGDFTTGAGGTVQVPLPGPGEYTVVETGAPAGYEISDPNSQTVTVAEKEGKEVKFSNKKKSTPPPGDSDVEGSNAEGQITIVKKDEDGHSLDGAVFKIEIDFSNGDQGGIDRFQVVDGSNTYYYAHPKDNTDAATVTVTEIKAPEGYVLDSTPQKVVVSPTYAVGGGGDEEGGEGGGGAGGDEEGGGSANVIIGDRPVLTFVNKEMECELIIYKYQKGNSSIALEGAQFDVEYADKTLSTEVWHVTTGADGKATISLPHAGVVKITETQAPENYKIIEVENKKTVTLTRGETKQVDIPNDKYGSLRIVKKDIDDHRGLAGAVFEVKKIGGAGEGDEATGTKRTVTTEADGTVLVEGLEPGSYQVKEISPPPYYVLSKNPVQTVEVLEGSQQTVELTFFNEAYTGMKIVKVDAQTGEGLGGAVFSVFKGNGIRDGYPTGDRVGDFYTSDNGAVILDKLEPGWYTVYEEQAPYGYVVDEQRWQLVEVKDANIDDTIQVIFRNQPKPKLRIVKKDKLTGELLEGAVFRVAKQNGTTYNEYTTDENGEILIENMDVDWYVITEMRAPDGYLLPKDPELDPVQLVPGKTTEVVVTNQIKPTLTIQKVDAVTRKPLKNATFKLTKQGASEYTHITTDSDGIARVEGLESGWYIVEEIKAPTGYILNTEIFNIELKPDENPVITIPNTKIPSLTIKKVDADTRSPLPDAEFIIHSSDGRMIYQGLTDKRGEIYIERIDPGTYTITELRAPNGYKMNRESIDIVIEMGKDHVVEMENSAIEPLYIQKVDAKTGKPLDGAVFKVEKTSGEFVGEYRTGITGFAIVTGLKPGYYVITEIKAPDGYRLSAAPKTVHFKAGAPVSVTIENEPLSGLQIVKRDADTGDALSDVTFRITKANGEFVGQYTTDGNGLVTLADLEPGAYTIAEIATKDGYILDNVPRTVEITTKSTTAVVVEWTNRREPNLQLLKVDEDTRKPLTGVTYKITKSDGELVGQYKTDENGLITLYGLDPDTYIVAEVATLDGYILDPTPKTVALKEGGPTLVSIELTNKKMPGLQLLKTDAATGEPLKGVSFKITTAAGDRVGDYKTDEFGLVTIPNLEPGTYTITEVATVEGYILDKTPKTVVLTEKDQGIVRVEISNKRMPGLQILKVDETTRLPLPGTTFKVTTVKGDVVGQYRTDASGLITLPELKPGSYIVTEVAAAEGYILNTTPHYVTLEKDDQKLVRLELSNKRKPGLQIYKVDEKTRKPLENVTFLIATGGGEPIGQYRTDKNGLIPLPDMKPGVYTITEVTAAEGYILDATPKTVELKQDEPAMVTVELTNKRQPGLQLLKVDEKTRQPLTGVTFKITKGDGKLVGQYRTDENGLVTIPNLEPGPYTITEVATIDGYILDTIPKTVILEEEDQRMVTVELPNKPLAGLQIRKIDGSTNLPLAGIEFEVRTPEGALIGRYTTGENGNIFIPNLEPGSYIVTEMTTRENYTIDAIPRTVVMKSGEMTTEVFKNYAYPVLTIKKADSVTGQPLAGAKFKLMDEDYREIGVITTSELGLVNVTKLNAGTYYVQEIQAPNGYVLDSTVRQISLQWGKTTVLEMKNTPRGSLRIQKVDAVTGKPLYNAVFNLYDSKDNLLGEYKTDNLGMIIFNSQVAAGKYTLKEVKAPKGYVLDDTPITVTVKAGETTELTIKNTPETGNIHITKVASDYNDITKDKAGAVLSGAVFELYNEAGDVVDRITTGTDGVAKSKNLPLGKYAIKEIAAPKHYITDGKPFYAELKVAGDLVKFKVENKPSDISTTVQKRGNVEVLPGDTMTWEFYNVKNTSNVALEEFYWHDLIPNDAVRATSFTTGVWSERVNMTAYFRTNLSSSYRVLKENLLSTTNHELSLSSSALGLKANEYVTDVKLVFGKVQPGFHETTRPTLTAFVLPNLMDGYSIVNRTDVGGRDGEEWIYCKDTWTTIAIQLKRGKLPQTGFGLPTP